MSEVDRLRVVYEVNDRAYTDAMRRMKATGETTNDAIVKASERGEKAVTKQGATTDAAVTKVVGAKKREEAAHKGAADAAEKASMRIVAANDRVERSSGSTAATVQNMGRQVGDMAVQIGMGTSASSALAMQLPQLLDGFGALGAVLGAVVAVGVPLAAMFFSSEEEAIDLDKTVKELTASLEALREAQVNAAIPLDQLIEKYGALGDEMAEVYANQLAIAAKELENLGKATLSALEDVAGMSDMVASLEALKEASENGGLSYQEYLAALRDLENQFGLTIAQALQWEGLMESVADAKGPEAQAQAWLEVNNWLTANREELEAQGVNVDDLAKKANELAGEYANAHLAAADTAAAAEAGAIATANWDAAAANLVASFNAAGAAARNAAAQVGALIAQQNAANGMQLGQLGGMDVFSPSSGRVITGLGGGNPLATPYAAPDFKPASVRGGGGRKSSKSGGSGKKPKVAEEAKLTREEIEALNETLYGSKDAQKQYEDAMSSIADTMAGVILEGESLRDGLASIFKGIANDILTSGIQQALMQSFGGSDWMMGLFGIRDPLTSALRGAGLPAIPSFDGGGFTGMGPRSGGLDGKGGRLAMIHPNETVLDHTRGQGAGGGSSAVSLSIDLRGTSGDKELDAKIARAGQAILAQVPSVMSNNQKRRG